MTAGISLAQAWDDRIAVTSPNDGGSLSYRYASSLPKACVHPLVTPRGHCLSGFEMSDHVWHRGLWFTIKFVNGTNFWEEHEPFGVQVSRSQPLAELLASDWLRISHMIEWTSAATGAVLGETRVLDVRMSDDGVGTIDWSSRLHATQDLALDRTPYTTWGGYGGLSFRAARELHEASFMLPNGETASGLTGQPHDWVVLSAKLDGGANERVSLGMIDHPSNPRSPSPWYCKSGNGFTFLNAAFLFHEPLTLQREQTLHFRYRVLYRDGVWDRSQFAWLADQFRAREQQE